MTTYFLPLTILTFYFFLWPVINKQIKLFISRDDLIPKARRTAIRWHRQVNHRYGKRSYKYHLGQVVGVAIRFKQHIPAELFEVVIAACWLHDTIEDTRRTYNDVKVIFGKQVAEIVYAVTNEKGRTRSSRANSKYYMGIMNTDGAEYVKLFDRIANIEHSKKEGGKMYDVYCKENLSFTDHFCIGLMKIETFEKITPIIRHLNFLCAK